MLRGGTGVSAVELMPIAAFHGRQGWGYDGVLPFAPHAPLIPSPEYAEAPVPPWQPNPSVGSRRRQGKPPYIRELPQPRRPARRVRREQLRMLLSVDDLVAELFEVLQETGQEDSTLAVFMSDQGHMWGEHGHVRKGPPYIPSIQIPLLVRWPGHVEEDSRDDRLASNVDLAPTLLDAAGISLPDDPPFDGHSLFGEMERERLLSQHSGLEERNMPPWASLITRQHQYIEYYDSIGAVTFREYYDLRADPWQLTNLLADGNLSTGPSPAEQAVLSQRLRLDRLCRALDSSGRMIVNEKTRQLARRVPFQRALANRGLQLAERPALIRYRTVEEVVEDGPFYVLQKESQDTTAWDELPEEDGLQGFSPDAIPTATADSDGHLYENHQLSAQAAWEQLKDREVTSERTWEGPDGRQLHVERGSSQGFQYLYCANTFDQRQLVVVEPSNAVLLEAYYQEIVGG